MENAITYLSAHRVFVVALTLTISVMSISPPCHARSTDPPNGKTGAPGEGTCRDCHDSFDLNSGPGSFALSGPGSFVPSGTYQILVSIGQTGQSRWGFQFTPQDIGSCTITEPDSMQIEFEFGKTYVEHIPNGTHAGDPGPVTWSFEWTAPADPPDSVVFYAAGNAANWSGTTSGDYIYTTTFTTYLDTVPPNPVLDLAIAQTGNDAVLNWSDPGDNIAVTGYEIYRSTEAHFEPVGSPLTTVSVLTWIDTGVIGDPAINYFYNVLAVDEVGHRGQPSNSVGEIDFQTGQ